MVLHDLKLWYILECHQQRCPKCQNSHHSLEQWITAACTVGEKSPALENTRAYCVMRITHILALNTLSHIPDPSHHPKRCVLSRMDVPDLWTQPRLLYILLGLLYISYITQASLYIIRDKHKPCAPLWIISVVCRVHFPSRVTLSHREIKSLGKLQVIIEKIFSWEISLEFLQFPLSLPMFLNDKSIPNGHPAENLHMCACMYTHLSVIIYII